MKPINTSCALATRSFGRQSLVPSCRYQRTPVLYCPQAKARFLSSNTHQKTRSSTSSSKLTTSTSRVTSLSLNHSISPGPQLSSHVQHRALSSQANMVSKEPVVDPVFEGVTGTWQYIVSDPETSEAVIIDPVLDYEPASQTVSTKTADSLLKMVQDKGYNVKFILETHAHADHLTSAAYLRSRLSELQGAAPLIGIGKRISQVQELFAKRYGIGLDGCENVFDRQFGDDETFDVGNIRGTAIHLPGHTPDHMGYKIGGNVFCGDTLFHADIGTARCDFPGGSATQLFKSGQKLLSLPEDVKVWTGHDYPPPDRKDHPIPYLTVKEHRQRNKHLCDGITEEQFVKMREERDATLSAPRLLHQSLQVNIRGGRLPPPTENGQRLLHLPLKFPKLDTSLW